MRTKAAPKVLCNPSPQDEPTSQEVAIQEGEVAFRNAVDKKLKTWKGDVPLSIELPAVLGSGDCPARANIAQDYRERGGWTVTETHNSYVHCLNFS